jgi:hypothetical protein
MAAKHGTGAIFATTMFLASSGQIGLIEALLSCHEHTDQIPSPPRTVALLRSLLLKGWPIIVGVILSVPVVSQSSELQPVFENAPAKEAVKGAFVLAGALILVMIAAFANALRKFLRELRGA